MIRSITLQGTDLGKKGIDEACTVLSDGGLVCLPCGGNYRIVADLQSASAVMKLFNSKRRTKDAPTLVFAADDSMLEGIAYELGDVRRRLIKRFWPGPMTVLIDPDLDLPRKLVKRMCRANGKIGVRVPASDIAVKVVQAFGEPLLVSSANIHGKKGAYSAAQVRKNFFNLVDLFLDDGDLSPAPHSTVVDVVDGEVQVIREGSLTEAEILSAAS